VRLKSGLSKTDSSIVVNRQALVAGFVRNRIASNDTQGPVAYETSYFFSMAGSSDLPLGEIHELW
jgi:hypothetical protein